MRPTKTERLPWRQVDGRAVIIHPKTQKVHELNGVGTFLWESADGNQSVDQISQKLSEEFQVESSAAKNDAMEFYKKLESFELIRWV